ncbi:MAG: hypothetical protein CAPSK01_004212 [Candidatus Accumulibacter vicinus]|uniref:Uncharacterized protein n=1 Tax=Candidatus Accumulibacter vicinus TaxID=2954382 RepID=A0A084XVN9_9PROT|nr:MAG: hypothetical protein CAPSK01_004212 [Candidatus Accumulibacter vicinus]
MRPLLDTVWQRRGTSWIWDEEAGMPEARITPDCRGSRRHQA